MSCTSESFTISQRMCSVQVSRANFRFMMTSNYLPLKHNDKKSCMSQLYVCLISGNVFFIFFIFYILMKAKQRLLCLRLQALQAALIVTWEIGLIC